MHLVETLDAGRRLLGHAPDRRLERRVERRILRKSRLDRGEQRGLFLARRMGDARRIGFGPRPEVHEQRRVTTVVEDHVRRAANAAAGRPLEDPVRVVPVLGERLALVREHGRAARGNRGRRVILCRVDVARSPAHLGAQRLQRLDQDGGLDRHVQAAGDARSAQRQLRREFVADRHQAGHLRLGDRDLLAAPVGERQVRDLEVGKALGFGCSVHRSLHRWRPRGRERR